MAAMTRQQLTIGVAAALAAGLMWGLVFVAPLLLPDYPATLLTFGRYLAFGLVTLPIAWWQRAALKRLTRADWWLAIKLSLVGNIIYYLALSAAIRLFKAWIAGFSSIKGNAAPCDVRIGLGIIRPERGSTTTLASSSGSATAIR